jgi:hypothetical protein
MTNSRVAVEGHLVADWLLRVATPAFLTLVDRNLDAAKLEELEPVTRERLEHVHRLRGLLKTLNPICDEIMEIHSIEWNARVKGGNADSVFFGGLSPLEFKKNLFPSLVEAGNHARNAFLPSRAGWIAYRIMMQSVSLALVRANGQLTPQLELVYSAVMLDLQARGSELT